MSSLKSMHLGIRMSKKYVDVVRIDAYDDMMELAGLYHTTNYRLLISMMKEMKRHEQHH